MPVFGLVLHPAADLRDNTGDPAEHFGDDLGGSGAGVFAVGVPDIQELREEPVSCL